MTIKDCKFCFFSWPCRTRVPSIPPALSFGPEVPWTTGKMLCTRQSLRKMGRTGWTGGCSFRKPTWSRYSYEPNTRDVQKLDFSMFSHIMALHFKKHFYFVIYVLKNEREVNKNFLFKTVHDDAKKSWFRVKFIETFWLNIVHKLMSAKLTWRKEIVAFCCMWRNKFLIIDLKKLWQSTFLSFNTKLLQLSFCVYNKIYIDKITTII